MPDGMGEREKRRKAESHLAEEGAIGGAGRQGGRLAREIGTKDELKRAFERPAGKTRVTKATEQEDAE
ncbi:hypothetical protein [Pontivivens ytuae]|uniref:Uncharacterized protein n=1 Tax=Pontivivens ytuae TaxID=2789856 RepID=A0A7S9LTH6_9RHOB|nr:hypothetical protein [Pontivivens ytuae]QPH54989.1 hypothetical protein I0K15_04345 [Pontivivens ytuae]